MKRSRRLGRGAFRAAVALAARAGGLPGGRVRAAGLPPIRHVFTIVLENEEFARSFGTGQAESPYLARTLPLSGAFVPNYYGTGHSSLDNYIAMTSGQGNNPKTSGDCHDPSTLAGDGTLHFDS